MKRLLVCWLAGFLVSGFAQGVELAPSARTVTFVCEHGVAKSVIAAAIFNREAASARLNVVARARGVEPEPKLQPATVEGLKKDGLDPQVFVPTRVSEADLKESEAVVSIGVAVEPAFLHGQKVREWDAIPPVSAGYGAARDAITKQVQALIKELQESER